MSTDTTTARGTDERAPQRDDPDRCRWCHGPLPPLRNHGPYCSRWCVQERFGDEP